MFYHQPPKFFNISQNLLLHRNLKPVVFPWVLDYFAIPWAVVYSVWILLRTSALGRIPRSPNFAKSYASIFLPHSRPYLQFHPPCTHEVWNPVSLLIIIPDSSSFFSLNFLSYFSPSFFSNILSGCAPLLLATSKSVICTSKMNAVQRLQQLSTPLYHFSYISSSIRSLLSPFHFFLIASSSPHPLAPLLVLPFPSIAQNILSMVHGIDENYRVITLILKKYGSLPLCLENYALFSLPQFLQIFYINIH